MAIQEKHFTDISHCHKIYLDNPKVKKRTVLDDLSGFERKRYDEQKERESEAQENHKKALANLEAGTAAYRIKAIKCPVTKAKAIKNKHESFDAVKERQDLELAVAYEKFKAVAQNADATIAEILAIRDGQ